MHINNDVFHSLLFLEAVEGMPRYCNCSTNVLHLREAI